MYLINNSWSLELLLIPVYLLGWFVTTIINASFVFSRRRHRLFLNSEFLILTLIALFAAVFWFIEIPVLLALRLPILRDALLGSEIRRPSINTQYNLLPPPYHIRRENDDPIVWNGEPMKTTRPQ